MSAQMGKMRAEGGACIWTTPLPRAFRIRRLASWNCFLRGAFGNPLRSTRRLARPASRLSRRAKKSRRYGAAPHEVYFTSCGTESDNWAIKGRHARAQAKAKSAAKAAS